MANNRTRHVKQGKSSAKRYKGHSGQKKSDPTHGMTFTDASSSMKRIRRWDAQGEYRNVKPEA